MAYQEWLKKLTQTLWSKWLDGDKKFCPLRRSIVWAKRATGIGYKKFPDLPQPMEVNEEDMQRMRERPKTIRERVEVLDRVMRCRGIKPIQRIWWR